MSIDATDGLSLPRRYWAIGTIVLGVAMAVLDGAVANIALPTMARDLGASPAQSIWVINAYQLVIMISLLALSSLGEIIGYARIYRVGLVIFGLASLACALSDSLTVLILSRILQGAGAACIMSVNTALIRFIYPRVQLGRAIGINAFVVAAASALGPTVAAGILAVASWQWIFAINIPLSIAAVTIARSLPLTTRASRRFDAISAVLAALTFGLFILGVDGIGHGMSELPRVAVELILALLFGTWLVRRQLSESAPLLPLDLLKLPIFTLSICTSVLSFAAQTLAMVTLPFFLQNVLGRTEVESGLLMTPWPITIMFVAPLSGRLSDHYPAGMLGMIGMGAFAVGLASLALLPSDPPTWQIVWRMVLCGAGFGLFQSPNNRTMIGSAPLERAGGASGMLGTARLFGQTIGAALVALIFNLFETGGTTVTLYTGAVFAVLAMGMSGTRLTAFGRSAPRQD